MFVCLVGSAGILFANYGCRGAIIDDIAVRRK